MKLLNRLELSSEIVVRMITDAVLVAASLFVVLFLHYVWRIEIAQDVVSAQAALEEFGMDYLNSFWVLSGISIIVFYLSGFYTRGRFYLGRFKALAIAQGVTVTYLVFSFSILLLWEWVSFPRSVLIPAWLLTCAVLIAARVWVKIWRVASRVERRLMPSHTLERQVKNVLVIGGAGYIGSAVLPKLLEKGYHVRLLDLLLYGTEPIDDLINHPRLEIIQADFRQVHKVLEAMRGMDAVIHLGAIVGDPACALDEDLTVEVNLMATRMIAEVAKSVGVERMVFASTCSVYGAGEQTLDEFSTLNPVSLYARSKIASEEVLASMADDHFAPVILRFGTIYGLSGRTRFDLVINLLTAKALNEGQITVFGGDQWRPFVHVDDAASAVVKAFEAPLSVARNEVFNVGSNDQNYTINQVAEIIHRIIPTAELINMGSDTDLRNYRVDFTKAKQILNLSPNWTVERGIEQVMTAIQSGQVTNYQEAKYSNVKFLKEEGFTRFIEQDSRQIPAEGVAQLAYDMQFSLNEGDWVTGLVSASTTFTDNRAAAVANN